MLYRYTPNSNDIKVEVHLVSRVRLRKMKTLPPHHHPRRKARGVVLVCTYHYSEPAAQYSVWSKITKQLRLIAKFNYTISTARQYINTNFVSNFISHLW